jgi:hypothetical protein
MEIQTAGGRRTGGSGCNAGISETQLKIFGPGGHRDVESESRFERTGPRRQA